MATAIARYSLLTVTSGAAFVLVVLTYGAGTDYALLFVSRYREELAVHEDHHDALREALRRSGPAVLLPSSMRGVIRVDLGPVGGPRVRFGR
ncbi:MMPL family transporter [Actinokineospora enzanensis]|uniref:MMPL family transporter n=1 Tax=Actinokineospora enzanensis TaxID=155975 RepID=UPI0003A4B651